VNPIGPDLFSGLIPPWLVPLLAQPGMQAAGALLVAAFLISRLGSRKKQPGAAAAVGKRLPPVGQRNVIQRALFHHKDALRIGSQSIEFHEQHLGIVAMSGGFKTTLMAQIARQRINTGDSVVVLTGADPDQRGEEPPAAGGYIIRPTLFPATFNAFEGSPSFAAQGWAQLFPTNSEAKVYHSAFEIAVMDYFEHETSFSLDGLIGSVLSYQPEDGSAKKLWDGMKEGYVGIRLQLMRKAFGQWIGTEISICDAMKLGIPLMFVCDSAEDPDLNRFSAALVWQAINFAVHHCKRPGTAIVDELARLPRDLVGDQVRTWRRNRWHLVVGTHAAEDFTPIIGDLVHTWALGRMVASAIKTRAWAHILTWRLIPPEAFGAHALERGYFWLVNLERVQKVGVPTYTKPKLYVKPTPWWHHFSTTATPVPGVPTSESQIPKEGGKEGTSGPIEAERQQGPVEMPPIFVQPFATPREMDIWMRHRFPEGPDGDYVLDYYCNPKTGRPEMQWRGQTWMAYMVVRVLWDLWEMSLPLDSDDAQAYITWVKSKTVAMELTVGHRDDLGCKSKRCGRREHIEWQGNVDNVAAQWASWRRRREAAAVA
jgi:hypothetical protein